MLYLSLDESGIFRSNLSGSFVKKAHFFETFLAKKHSSCHTNSTMGSCNE